MADDADQRKRESMLIINDYAAKFFAENLFKETEESHKALDYATSRWPIEYIRSFGIGYASNSWDTFSQWAKAKDSIKTFCLN